MSSFTRHPIVRTVLAVQKRFGRDDGSYLAASIAHYGFLSLFPLILLGLAVVGFILAGDPVATREWADRLSSSVPGLGPLLGRNLDTIIESRGSATLVGAVALLWSGTRITEAAGRATSVVWGVPRQRSFLKQKGWSLGSTALLGSLGLLGFAVAGIAGSFEGDGPRGALLAVAAALVAFIVDFALFLFAYRVLVRRPGPPFPQLWPGALFAAVAWTLLKLGGSWLAATQVEKASAVYGSFAVTVGMLLLMTFAAQVFMYGAELNAVLMESGGGQVRDEERVTSASGNGRSSYQGRSTSDLVKGIAGDATTLVRKEIELAKQEVKEGIAGKIKGLIGLGAAAVLAFIGVLFLGASLASALDIVLAPWLSRMLVALLFLVIGGLAVAFGISSMKAGSVTARETRRTVKEDVEWARTQLKR